MARDQGSSWHRAVSIRGPKGSFTCGVAASSRRIVDSTRSRFGRITTQYAPVGAAAALFSEAATGLLQSADHPDLAELTERFTQRRQHITRYREAYRHYCWDTPTLDDYKLAPFHLLATAGQVHCNQPHTWHMDFAVRLAAADPALFQSTKTIAVDLDDDGSVFNAVAWWEDLTSNGGEGMVVKPSQFLTKGRRGLLQPAVKCRGREYLRIIYGPEYTAVDNLRRLKQRGLGAKRSLATREFALGLEALHRFVDRAPLRQVHECVFAVLALESEPVDPRL